MRLTTGLISVGNDSKSFYCRHVELNVIVQVFSAFLDSLSPKVAIKITFYNVMKCAPDTRYDEAWRMYVICDCVKPDILIFMFIFNLNNSLHSHFH